MTKSAEIWVIDDDRSIRWVLEQSLTESGYLVQTFSSAAGVLEKLKTHRPGVIITDIRMPGMDGFDLLSGISATAPGIPVIVMTAHTDLQHAVASYEKGAFEYLPKPFDLDEVTATVRRALEKSSARQGEKSFVTSDGIFGKAPAMQEIFRTIGRLSNSSIPVLITGETGTGKELIAKALHQHSPRSSGSFIALNMSAIPANLIEAELFGYERGAFTGAEKTQAGRFEQANAGTLFLDEIGDMPLDLQTRLLRVLSEGTFYRVGGRNPIQVDARIIAATHQSLESMAKAGQFREDLLHRLNVIRLQLPALRERRDDIPILANHFLNQAANDHHVGAKTLGKEAIYHLQQFDWPGNVRQLENLCQRITVMCPGQIIGPGDLPEEMQGQPPHSTPEEDWTISLRNWAKREIDQGHNGIADMATTMLESTLMDEAMRQTHGRKNAAATLLGWGRNTITRKLKELKVESKS